MLIRDDSERDKLKQLLSEKKISPEFVRSLLDKHHLSLNAYLQIVFPEEGKVEKKNADIVRITRELLEDDSSVYREEVIPTLSLSQSISTLCESLKHDDGYFYSWQANMAMAFYDEYHNVERLNSGPKGALAHPNIHAISNQAAKNFLNLLISLK